MSNILKRIAGLAFAVAFLMAIVLFTDYGRGYIPLGTAKIIFIVSGAIGLVLNLISFQSGKHTAMFNMLYWAGSIVIFIGLIFVQFRLPYGMYIVIGGMVALGVSILLPDSLAKKLDEKDKPEVLDDL